MLLAGDEHGHSQHGNNNAYCQDNALTWLDWNQANSGLTAFTAALIHLRRCIPALTSNRWWQEG
jgi:glycogen operon protein